MEMWIQLDHTDTKAFFKQEQCVPRAIFESGKHYLECVCCSYWKI